MRGLLTVKLRRDLRAAWSRVVLMVVAIAVSLMVFGAVLYAWATTSRETERAYLSTEPASATILLERGVPADELNQIAAELANRPDIITATARTQFSGDVRVNDMPRDIPLQVFVAAADDPMQIAKFDVGATRWPPSPGEILIGRDTLELLDVRVGDTLGVELPTGDSTRLRVSGVVYDPSLAPAPQEQRGHAYMSATSLTTAANPALLDQLKVQVADQPNGTAPTGDRDVVVAAATDAADWLEREYGLLVREVQVPEPKAHPHQGQADALLLALLAGGGAALLLSTVLVANMLNGLFIQQIPQIGIMKAVGARTCRIAGIYLTMTLSIAAAATLLALAPAIMIGQGGAVAVLDFLGIEAVSTRAPWWVYAMIVVAGVALPLLMALPPLVKASRTTVRAAIDHRGMRSSARRPRGVLTRPGRFPILDRGILMALRNSARRPARFLLAAGLLASAGTVFVAGMSTSDGVAAIEESAEDQLTWDIDVQLAEPVAVDTVTALVEQLPEVRSAEGWTTVQTGVSGSSRYPVTRTYPDQGHGGVQLTAVPAETDTFAPPRLLEGRWLRPGETGAIVLNQIARATSVPGIEPGDTAQLTIAGQRTDWRVVGIAMERGGGTGGMYVTAQGFAEALDRPVQASQLRVTTARGDEQTRGAVAEVLTQRLADAGVEVKAATSVSQRDEVTEGHLGPIILILLAISVALAIVGCIGLASIMSANVLDRTREFGIMHAIGARPRTVRRIVVSEGVFVAAASCVLAAIPTVVLIRLIGAGLGNLFMYAPLPYRISTLAAVIWVVIVGLGGALATDAAANRASRLTVRDALAYV